MSRSRTPPVFTDAAIAAAWHDAQAVWPERVTLAPPRRWTPGHDPRWDQDEPLAYIDLETRQVVVNYDLLGRIGAEKSLTGVLAHEIGHHVRHPHSLGLSASLQVIEQRLVPGLRQSLTNLFFDLLINEHVGRTRAGELMAVYRGFARQPKATASPLFAFYLALYEELWGRPAGDLLPPGTRERMEQAFPGWRADARLTVQTLYGLAGPHLQFTYFLCRALPYIENPESFTYVIPLGADVAAPGVDDYDGVLGGHPSIDDALREARERGWLDDSGVSPDAPDPLTIIERVTRHRPGDARGEFREALVSRHYRRLVDRHLLPLPTVAPQPEPFLPTTLSEWQPGDDPRSIDWTASVLAAGPLAAAAPLRRELEPDLPPPEAVPERLAIEIYLDTSGSMPNPATALNAMTLAAQVLSASAIRRGGRVRGIVYSSGKPLVSDWMRDEERARRFLLHYVGGGTDFPFELLERHAKQEPDALRVIVSDWDFLGNLGGRHAPDRLQAAVESSRVVVALLAATDRPELRKALARHLADPRFRLATVADLSKFGEMAAELARALMGD